MHPNEMKKSCLEAAAKAKKDGFSGTAAALLALAEACADEATELSKQTGGSQACNQQNSPKGRAQLGLVSH